MASLTCVESLANTPLHATTLALAGVAAGGFGFGGAVCRSCSGLVSAVGRRVGRCGCGLAGSVWGFACSLGLIGSGQRSCTVGVERGDAGGGNCAAATPGRAATMATTR